MNHIYKIIWCSSLQIFKVCSENAKSSKTKSSKTKSARNELIESKSKVITIPKLTTLALLLSATSYALAGDLTHSSTIVADNDSKTEAGLAITTTANYANAGTAKNTGSLTLSNSTINTSGEWSFGLSSGTNSNIEITDLTINTSGERGYGILAESGGKITGNADITVTGQKAHAVQAGSQGTNSLNPYNGSTAGDVILTGGKITVDINKTINNNWATALHAIDQGTITADNIVIASNSRGLLSESNSKISITNSSINTTGSEAALSANNDQLKTDPTIKGGVINVSNTNIITTGVGASAEKGGAIIFNNDPNKDLNAGTLTTQGYGLESKDVGSSIEATNLDIIVTGLGDQTFGVNATNKGSVILNGGSVTTKGLRGYGLMAHNGGEINSNANITVTGANTHAVQAGGTGTNPTKYDGTTAGKVVLTGGTLKVENANGWAAGLHAVDQGEIDASNIFIESKVAGAHAESNSLIKIKNSNITADKVGLVANNDQKKYDSTAQGGKLIVSNTTVTTSGNNSIAASADFGGYINLQDSSIVTTGTNAIGVSASNGGTIASSNTLITTNGSNSYGAVASNGGSIELKAGEITTHGNKAHGLQSQDEDSSIIATDLVIDINSTADQTFGVHATNKGSITLNGGSITTDGERGYGIIAQNGGHVESSTNITVNGAKAHAVQAGGLGTNSAYTGSSAGTINLTGGKLTVNATNGTSWATALHAVDSGKITASTVDIESKSYAALSESSSSIEINDSTIKTTGNNVAALSANNDRKKDNHDVNAQGGIISVNNTDITTSGDNSIAASADFGGYINLQDSSIVTTGTNAIGVSASNGGSILLKNSKISTSGNNASALTILNSGTIAVNKTDLSSANASTASIVFDKQNQIANLTFGENTTAITNNGTLLLVSSLNNDGNDGIVNFTLDNGSKSTGDIIDARSGLSLNGGTNVTLEEKATWAGKLVGIKNFVTKQQSTANFTDRFEIGGDLQGNIGSIFNFSKEGASIGGNLTGNGTIFNFSKEEANAPITTIIGNIVLNNSQTKGGTINTPITVSGNVDINDASSIFGGNWKIDGKLTNSGNLNIGNSIGKVTVGRGLILNDTSTYNVEVNYQGDSDIITVTNGEIKLGGNIVVSTLDNFKLNSPYTIIQHNNSEPLIEGEFKSVRLSKPSAFLDVSVDHNTNSVDVKINRNDTTFASVTTSTNQAAIANALDQKPASLNDNRINPYMRVAAFTIEEQTPNVINKILQLSADEAKQAFEELSGNTNASIRTGLVSTANITADVVNNRMRSTFNGVGSKQTAVLHFVPAEKSINTGLWASGFGSWIDQKSNANANGLKTSTGGFLTGVDIGLSSGWNLGIATGYSKTDMDAKGHYASTTSDNWHLGAYGGNQWGSLGLRAGVVYTGSSLDGKRAVNYGNTNEILKSDYHAHSTQVFADVGYQINLAPATIEPFVNLSHVNLRTKGYSETGGDAALEVASDTTNTTFSTFGVRTAVPFTIGSASANLKGTLGWRHAYGDITPVATQSIAGGVFTVDGIAIAKNTALIETGLDFQISPVATASLSYVGQYGSGIRENGLNATFNYKF